MTKIKNFRITLRSREMARWLKANKGMQVTADLEAAIDHAIIEAKPLIKTAAVYTTLTQATAAKVAPIEFPQKSVAASIVAVTVGTELDRARAAAEQKGDELQTSLIDALLQEALQQSIQFVVRLTQEQAKEEDCEMSPPILGQESSQLAPLAALLGVHRIGINLDAETGALPSEARLVWTFWTPLRKSSKREAPARPEKAAV